MKFKPAALLATAFAGALLPAQAQQPDNGAKFDTYEVPAMSSVKRLPTEIPSDGKLSNQLRIVAAQGEFEPASFMLVPRANVANLRINAAPLTGQNGTIPASAVDIKVVKTWYQAGTAWYSYFADNNRRELVPELLLNDENLVRVDYKTQENYLRVGNQYRWISYPRDKADREYFNYLTEPVADAKTLQPVQLTTGENKQIWVTVKVPAGTPAGVYRGPINLIADGQSAGAMNLEVRVLPFALPMPKTYYNIDNDFLVTIYGTDVLSLSDQFGVAPASSDQTQLAVYKDLLDHNVFNARTYNNLSNKPDRKEAEARVRRELRLMKAAGFPMNPMITAGWAYYAGSEDKNPAAFRARVDDYLRIVREEVGPAADIYMASYDEASTERVKIMRELAEYVHSKGAKMWVTTSGGRHYNLEGYAVDLANHGGWPERETAQTWHTLGAKVASYAGPHTGPENPNAFRLWEGLGRYKANYDASFNYKYHSELHSTLYAKYKSNVWNDFDGGAFRQFNMVYPTVDGVIDTLAWEGFREGIDDIRYATKLKQEAAAAIATGKVGPMFTAKKALMWLELMDEQKADLNAVRMEMVERILEIQAATKEAK